MKNKMVAGMLLLVMVFNLSACTSKLEKKIEDNIKKSIDTKASDLKQAIQKSKFKEVNGKMEVYLPVRYICTETQGSDDAEMVVQNEGNFDYNENGLLQKEQKREEDNVDGYSVTNYNNSYSYNNKYQLTQTYTEKTNSEGSDEIEEYYFNYNEEDRLLNIEEISGEYDIFYEFDTETGKLIQYNSDDEVYRDYTYEYDENGNITSYDEEYNRVSDDYYEYSGGYDYEYNTDGKVIKKVHTDYDGKETEAFVEYDKDGYITKCDEIKFRGLKIDYNKKHKPLTLEYGDCEMQTDGSEKLKNEEAIKMNYEYENDLISKVIIYTSSENREILLNYDENGNLIEITTPEDKNFKISIEYKTYYIDKEYFDYYLKNYYYAYLSAPLDDYFRWRIIEINNDLLQVNTICEFCDLPFTRMEDLYVGEPLKSDKALEE